jgi:hypothetical protein
VPGRRSRQTPPSPARPGRGRLAAVDEPRQPPPGEEITDQVDVREPDRLRFPEPLEIVGADFAVGETGPHGDPVVVTGTPPVVGGDDDPERLAPAGRAVDLDEGDVVAPGEDADPGVRVEPAAGRAVDAGPERVQVVARIHRSEV